MEPVEDDSNPAIEIESQFSLKVGDLVGRYQIKSMLGSGGFGAVYHAIDSQLNRDVAIKVPLPKYTNSDESVELYLSEARLIAQLDHPNIVPVFDSGRDQKVACFFVTKYVEGQVLSNYLRSKQPDFLMSARICRDLASALHYAHARGVIHRDVKPGNIIVDNEGRAYLIDFGLAMNDESYGTGSGYVGTPEFMSPEQARGEGHLVDGRSDVYSLGVVLYRMISGRMPYTGSTRKEILRSVAYHETKPPRQIDDSIPHELERICLRAIAKRSSDRYTTAKDLAEDLDLFVLESKESSLSLPTLKLSRSDSNASTPVDLIDSKTPQPCVVPKGLRAFDEGDAEFFLSLLPGPVDRLGFPQQIRFLKKLIEATQLSNSESIGVIYGPSGCGKSSLIRAGLIPHLSERIRPIIIEASGYDTESAIRRALRSLDPDLPQTVSLAEMFANIRRGRTQLHGRKVVIFLDQFEQWLNVRTDFQNCELVAALRQCDGVNLQCLLSVRDDFWVSVSRMLREVEIEVREGQNAVLIDLFDVAHARQVLTEVGRAYGGLPKPGIELSREHDAFLDRAIEELSERRRVFPVRLAVFAEMMRDKKWHLKNLEYAGGGEGIGVAFLNETFNVPEAPTRHKRHASGAQRVLAMLIPKSGADLKGSIRTGAELRAAARYPDEREFNDLMTLLDKELRLLTPVEHPAGAEPDSTMEAPSEEPTYQLTHDYLVTPLRTWLAQRRRETLAGRAQLRLEETAGFWALHREKKLLPTWSEWLFIRLFMPSGKWTETQRAMMTAGGRVLGRRVLFLMVIVGIIIILTNYQVKRIEADIAYKKLLAVPVTAIPEAIEELRSYPSKTIARVRQGIHAKESANENSASTTAEKELSEEQFRLRLAAAVIDHSRDPSIESYLLHSDPDTAGVIREVLTHPDQERDSFFWGVLESADFKDEERLRAASFLAVRTPSDRRWSAVTPTIASTLATEPYAIGEKWGQLLKPVSGTLLDAISELLVSEPTPLERARLIELARLFSNGETSRLKRLKEIAAAGVDQADLQAIRRNADASAALAELDDWQFVIESLSRVPDPTLRTQVISALESADIEINEFLDTLEELPAGSTKDGVRAGILISLSGEDTRRLAKEDWQRLDTVLLEASEDPLETEETRSVSAWLASRWRTKLTTLPTVQSSRMIPLTLPANLVEAAQDRPWRFEIKSCPVTVQEFLKFRPEHSYDRQTASVLSCPVNEVTWFDAVAYCNWLSERAGLEPDQWCYVVESNGNSEDVISIPADVHQRRGFRLPTAIEWEFCIRAGTATKWSWGRSAALADRYAWSLSNSGLRTHPVAELRPNPFGLFDMHGNVWEWLHDTPEPSGTPQVGSEPRFLRGGTYLNDIESIGWESTIANSPFHKTGADGFRVVRRIFE